MFIITGYIAGITAKLMSHQVNFVLAAYFLNLAIVLVNLGVYFRNKRLYTIINRSYLLFKRFCF